MKDEQLIKLVRKYPALYDLSNPKYMDTNYKNAVWSKIGADMATGGQSCKTRWSNIRDNYRKSLKKLVTVSGQNAKNIKVYKYSEQLSFLRKYFEEKEIRSNIDQEGTPQNITCEDESRALVHDNELNTTDTTEPNNTVTEKSQTQPCFSKHSIYQPQQKKRKPECNHLKSAAATVMEYLLEQKETSLSSALQQQDPVDAFLVGVAPALKKLTPQLWHYAKADIFATVQKYEMIMLTGQEKTFERTCHISPTGTYDQDNETSNETSSNHSLHQYFHDSHTENNAQHNKFE